MATDKRKPAGRRVSPQELERRRQQRLQDTDTEAEQEFSGYQVLDDQEQATSAAQWAGARGVVLLLPTGNKCRVRRSGFEGLIAAGQIPNTLLPLVQEALAGGPGKRADENALLSRMLADPKGLKDLFEMYENVCLFTVLEPRVLPVPRDGNGQPVPIHDRPTDVEGVWVDMVDMQEKAAIFNYATTGTGELEPFRPE